MIILTQLLLTEPVFVFAVLIAIIFLSPFFFRIFRIPDVAAFIISGIIVGPYGLNILSRDASIELLGTIGLLYLMFVAGIELDVEKLKISKKHSIIFGISTFIFPFFLGMLVCTYLFQLNFKPSILIAIMFSTHTLIAYPIVRKLSVHRDISVLTAVGGTIITDTLVLVILSIITNSFRGETISLQIVQLVILFGGYLLFIFYSYPRISAWFFKHIKRDRPVHFLYILFMVSVSSVLAKLIGIEPIIGAFVAGLALNKSIPKNSLLMHHIDFVGNILFIPSFLIGIGMIINTKILFSGIYLWYVSMALIVTALAGKWGAAFISQKILHFSREQRNLLFGLTSSHAAATIAVILIGFERKIIDETIFNAVVLIILASSLIASFITEKYGKRLVVSGIANRGIRNNGRILVPISNPSTMFDLVLVANNFISGSSVEPIYVLSIVNDDKKVRENLSAIRENLETNISEFNNLAENIKVITRVDLNVSSGILRAAKEYLVSEIVFGWSVKTTASQKIFGSIFDHLYQGEQTLYACNFKKSITEIKKLIIILPENIEHEISFKTIIDRILKLPVKRNHVLDIYYASEGFNQQFGQLLQKKLKAKLKLLNYQLAENILYQNDEYILNILFLLRKHSAAYRNTHINFVNNRISAYPESNFIIIVPGCD